MQVVPLSSSTWRFRDAAKKSWLPAVVPGCVHTDLRRAGKIPDPFWGTNENQLQWIEERDWEYRTTFTATAALLETANIELVADGLDTVAVVTLNGTEVARTENMFVGWRWPVKPLLRAGKNELRIRFASAMAYIRSHEPDHRPAEINDPVGRCTVIRKQQCQFGWDWGPRFVTAGIWRDIRIEAWTGNRIETVRIEQQHESDGRVRLKLAPALAQPSAATPVCHWRLMLGDALVGSGAGNEIEIARPELWWPNGQGAQPLYRIDVEVAVAGAKIAGAWSRRIGLRRIELDRHADEWGESFQFRVNGRAIFAKGANWIPAHSFVAGLTRADYLRDLHSAAQAHMNMIRVWGGGIYESEDFYDVCDELGLLVWQDFMFSCTIYPASEGFRANVCAEAEYQMRRLRHRACLALWCGNNEVWSCNANQRLNKPGAAPLRENYDALFHRTLAEVAAANDPATAYWPSSPWRGDPAVDHASGEKRGDTHYWDVWHARHPVKDYEKWKFRFVSEFGMQSYSSAATNATFCPVENGNVFGPEMENHQKNRAGNQIILDYVSRRYRFPKSQDDLIYLSQLNQAHCMQTGVEHYRRLMPRCMGALYWQLNDCWPVASWSSIEFTGRWRALHHLARRFFAPTIASAQVPGDELPGIGNYRHSTVSEVHLFTVSDAPETQRGRLSWDVFRFDGRVLERGEKAVTLRGGESRRQQTLDLAATLAKHGRDNLYVRIALEIAGRRVSEDTAFLAPPRFLALPKGRTAVSVRMPVPTRAVLTFTSTVFQHRFAFDLPGVAHEASDNFFELYPGEKKSVTVDLARPLAPLRLKGLLVWRSLADTYSA